MDLLLPRIIKLALANLFYLKASVKNASTEAPPQGDGQRF
jgi:hypothetical protein